MPDSDFYTVVHKHLRRSLFDLSLKLGAARSETFSETREALRALAGMLRGHGQHEDLAMRPLLAEQGRVEELDRAHHRLEADLTQIEVLADAATALTGAPFESAALDLYRAWNRFLAEYLQHLDDEERDLFAALGTLRGEVSGIAALVRKRGPDGMSYLRALLPVLAHRECVAIVAALEVPSLISEALLAAEQVLPSVAARQLKSALG